MVFAYSPGKPSKAPKLPQPPTWTHDDHDPFPSVDAWRVKSVEERISWLGDMGIWTQEFVHQCAELTQKYDTLKDKLEDPKLADHPARQKHVYRAEALWDDMVQAGRDALWTIAEADRAWQSLAVAMRVPVVGHWHVPAETPRLVGQAWYGLALFERWGRRFRLSRLHYNDFPEPLIRDLHEVNIWAWQPTALPPDPFGGQTFMSATLAAQLEGRK